MKFNIFFKNIKNMQFNGQIFKICSHVNFFSQTCSQTSVPLTIYQVLTNKQKKARKFYLTKILKDMQLAVLIIRLSCYSFKIRKFVEGNFKILYICVCVCFFFGQYMKFFFYYILYNLSFLMTTLEKFSGVAATCERNLNKLHFLFSHFFSPNKRVFHPSIFSTQTKHNVEKIKPLLSPPPPITWGELCPFSFNTIKRPHNPFAQKQREFTSKK